jgi:hypothetical protein
MSTDAPGSLPPVPQYGEYAQAPSGPPPYQPNYVSMAGQQQQMYYGQPYMARRPLRTADAIVSIVLLVLGLFGLGLGVTYAFALDLLMQQEYTQLGLGTYVRSGPFAAVQAVIIVSHVVLFAISTPLTIVLIVKRKITFWIPLTAGALATIVFWGVVMTFIFTDPLISDVIQSRSSS